MTTHPAQYIVGPTAVGKSDLAHALAMKNGWSVLSADSMNIYRGMDVGTAKASPAMQGEVSYLGIDLAQPSQRFSVGEYITYAESVLSGEAPVLVCGGTGLYIKALSEGLDSSPPPDEAKRQAYEKILGEGGVAALQDELRRRSKEAFDELADVENPRRLIRALEKLDAGFPERGSWHQPVANLMIGIDMPRERLHERISLRARKMFGSGLVDEVKRMVDAGGQFSGTAAQAIGYQEALAVLGGSTTEEAAIERTTLRTRQLAKKQMTWFRNKMTVTWLSWDGLGETSDLVKRVEEIWDQHECGVIRFKTP